MKQPRKTQEPEQTKNVQIIVGNVWGDECKFLQFDIVEMDATTADFLIGRKQARATSDDATVTVDRDIRPFKRVAL